MRNARRSTVDQVQRLGFEHEAEGVCARLSLKNNGLSVEAFTPQDFIRSEGTQPLVTKDKAIVPIANASNEKIMVGQYGFEIYGPNLFADRHDHQGEGKGLALSLTSIWGRRKSSSASHEPRNRPASMPVKKTS